MFKMKRTELKTPETCQQLLIVLTATLGVANVNEMLIKKK